MNIIGIIPARMASTRFPGKPLAEICGIPMVGHVFFRSKMSSLLNEVYIATCDQAIMDYAHSIKAKAIMTADTHKRASDRTAEAVEVIESDTGKKIDVVVMIQGDEPMILPEMIDRSVKTMMGGPDIMVTNLMAPLKSQEEHEDPNEVKVVVDKNDFALYFSREPIPSRKKSASDVPMFKQVCIIPFRRDFLVFFNEMEPTPLEEIESVDMLRIMEHGYKVKMIQSDFETYSVDTPQDLNLVEKLMMDDPLISAYRNS